MPPPCRRASPDAICRADVVSKCASRARFARLDRVKTLLGGAVRRSATSACAPRTGRRRRSCSPAIVSSSVRCRRPSRVCCDHPRLVALEFDGSPGEIWEGLARHGRPIQYSHVPPPLALWDTWTPIAGPPVAFEPPSAGFVLDWRALASMTARGVRFATITHAAGISSTGDPALDALLPFDEPYRIPDVDCARATRHARARPAHRRHRHHCRPGTRTRRGASTVSCGRATEWRRRGSAPSARLRVVDAILSGTHEPGSSHYELLRAFATTTTLGRIDRELDARGYRTHEFGDSVFLDRMRSRDAQFVACAG